MVNAMAAMLDLARLCVCSKPIESVIIITAGVQRLVTGKRKYTGTAHETMFDRNLIMFGQRNGTGIPMNELAGARATVLTGRKPVWSIHMII